MMKLGPNAKHKRRLSVSKSSHELQKPEAKANERIQHISTSDVYVAGQRRFSKQREELVREFYDSRRKLKTYTKIKGEFLYQTIHLKISNSSLYM